MIEATNWDIWSILWYYVLEFSTDRNRSWYILYLCRTKLIGQVTFTAEWAPLHVRAYSQNIIREPAHGEITRKHKQEVILYGQYT